MNTMNYIVKSAVNGVSQKLITIELTAADRVLTIKGEVMISHSNVVDYTEGLMDHFDIADWEITHLDGKEYSHSSVYNALSTLHGAEYIGTLATDIESALIEVAGSMMTESVKTPQNAPDPTTADFESMPMEERILRIDWEAVKAVFEQDFDFSASLQESLDYVSLNDSADVEINTSYGGRDFSVDVSFDTYNLAKEMVDTMADTIYEFCKDRAEVNATATAA